MRGAGGAVGSHSTGVPGVRTLGPVPAAGARATRAGAQAGHSSCSCHQPPPTSVRAHTSLLAVSTLFIPSLLVWPFFLLTDLKPKAALGLPAHADHGGLTSPFFLSFL